MKNYEKLLYALKPMKAALCMISDHFTCIELTKIIDMTRRYPGKDWQVFLCLCMSL